MDLELEDRLLDTLSGQVVQGLREEVGQIIINRGQGDQIIIKRMEQEEGEEQEQEGEDQEEEEQYE